MTDKDLSFELFFHREEELRELERLWHQGKLRLHVEQLLAFVSFHRAEIVAAAGPTPSRTNFQHAIKIVIGRRGSVHHATELRDQTGAIHNEIWYAGERGEYDQTRIAGAWVDHHARAWRRWRLKEYCFVVDHSMDQFLPLLPHSPSADSGGVLAPG